MANSKEGNRHIRKTAGVTGAVLATAELMSALSGTAVVANVDTRPTAIVTKGQMPSLNSPVTLFQREGGVRPAVERAYVQPIAIESVEQAVNLFGADAYSRDKENWFINEYGGATLRPDPSDQVHRVRTSGAVVEGWIKIEKPGEHQALTLVVRPRDAKKVDINDGTFWKAPEGKEKALWQQVRDQVIAKEAIEQPDVPVVPVCIPDHAPSSEWITPVKIKSRVYAANTYGLDKYSRNPNNWKLNKDGSVTLREDPSGLEHKVTPGKSGVLTGWNKVDRVNGYDAIAFVAVQLPHGTYGKSVTAYKAPEGKRVQLHGQLLKQTVKREAKEQPGVIVLPLCN